MIGIRMLHLALVLSTALLDSLLFRWATTLKNNLPLLIPPHETPPAHVAHFPQKKKSNPSPQEQTPSLFPKIVERPYVPLSVPLGRKYVEFELREGNIKTPPAPEQKPRVPLIVQMS